MPNKLFKNIKVVVAGQLKGFLTLPSGQNEISLGQLLKNWDIENPYTKDEWTVVTDQGIINPDSLENVTVKTGDDIQLRRKAHFSGIVGGSHFL